MFKARSCLKNNEFENVIETKKINKIENEKHNVIDEL